jgi:hypothetical protein
MLIVLGAVVLVMFGTAGTFLSIEAKRARSAKQEIQTPSKRGDN